jgi:hypothetical protein
LSKINCVSLLLTDKQRQNDKNNKTGCSVLCAALLFCLSSLLAYNMLVVGAQFCVVLLSVVVVVVVVVVVFALLLLCCCTVVVLFWILCCSGVL